jgi:hypothetical protein
VTLAALGPSAWAYVNGGDFHSTAGIDVKRLQRDGWGVITGAPLPSDCDRTKEVFAAVTVGPPESADYQRWVNRLVGRAVQALPEAEADKVSPEAKREAARLAREAIREAVVSKRQIIRRGHCGAVQYQAGVYAFESYWETNYDGKREVHAHRSGLVPYVAVRVVETKDPPPARP